MKTYQRVGLDLPADTLAGKPGVVIKPGEALAVRAHIPEAAGPVRRRLRVIGEPDLFRPWISPAMLALYRSVVDALDATEAHGEKYSLHLRGAGEEWPRNAYIRLGRDALCGAKTLTLAVMAKAAALAMAEGSELVVELGFYLERPGRHPDDVYDPPDAVQRLAIPPGTYAWRELAMPIHIPPGAVALLVRVGGRAFSGEVWIGSPRLFHESGETCIPPFMPETAAWGGRNYNWVGENLSRCEWPEFEICVDEGAFFHGPVFALPYRAGDFDVPLPDLAPGAHSIHLKLLDTHAAALPYRVQGIELMTESARAWEIVGYPEYPEEHQPVPVLVELNEGGASRLDVLHVPAGAARAAPELAVNLGGREELIRPQRIVRRAGAAEILLSSTDSTFISQAAEDLRRYLAWYVERRIGNAMGLRPCYHTTGSRLPEAEAWAQVKSLLEKLGMRYFLFADGGTLNGAQTAPPSAMLAGPRYLGRQAHEADGAFGFWGVRREDGLYADLLQRASQRGSAHQKSRPLLREADGRATLYFDPGKAATMREAAGYFQDLLRASKGEARRHTGPSTLFRYFYEVGYEWLGAETMYGPDEVMLSALRGASRAFGKTDFGAHLAMQWNSFPHDTPRHAERYFLALATCYLQGAGQINLEDGLWRIAYEQTRFDRFSHACAIHHAAHERFRRFLETHPRRGALCTPLGILQGRYCGWSCFGRGPVWGSSRAEFRFGAPEESFDLLKALYPRSELDAIYRGPCTDDRSEGWFTGMPYGPVDILPLAAPGTLGRYRALAFLGWNTFDEADFEKLLGFVEAGGTLLLAKPHLSTQVKRQQPPALPRESAALRRLLGAGIEGIAARSEHKVGAGTVIYYPQEAYPAEPALREAYAQDLIRLAQQAVEPERERGWAEGGEDVSFSAYDRAEGRVRTLYLLNIDWWSGRESAQAVFLFGRRRFPIRVRAGCIETLSVAEGFAVMPEAPDADVLDIARHAQGLRISVQSDAGTRLRLFAREGTCPEWIAVEAGGVQEIVIPLG